MAVGLKTLAVDLDGVLHRYSRGWSGGEMYDEPVQGAVEAITELVKGWQVVVFTARAELEPVREWLAKHGFPPLEVTNRKPPAWAYIDDRAIEFKDWKACLERIASEVREAP